MWSGLWWEAFAWINFLVKEWNDEIDSNNQLVMRFSLAFWYLVVEFAFLQRQQWFIVFGAYSELIVHAVCCSLFSLYGCLVLYSRFLLLIYASTVLSPSDSDWLLLPFLLFLFWEKEKCKILRKHCLAFTPLVFSSNLRNRNIA